MLEWRDFFEKKKKISEKKIGKYTFFAERLVFALELEAPKNVDIFKCPLTGKWKRIYIHRFYDTSRDLGYRNTRYKPLVYTKYILKIPCIFGRPICLWRPMRSTVTG